MKKLKRISMLLLIALTMFIGSCEKEPVKKPPTRNYNTNANLDLGSKVNAKFFGKIVDESGLAISGVTIEIGNKTATTDAKGIFIVDNASVFEKMAFVSATKAGYFFGSRSLIPSTSAINNVKITMLALDIVGTVNSGEEKTIELSSGAKIDFKGKYIDANGNAYSGTVNIAFKHLPALANATADQMPGMLYAQDQNENAGVLETYGMMAVELTSSTGAELQIDPSSVATIHMPVDASQLPNAPATIPLWSFDEIAGYWIEEGEAILINGEYVGEVSHFSFWNCDVFADDAQLNGTVTDQNGNILSNVTVAIITPSAATSGQTASDGTFFTFIPANVAITLQVRDDCGNTVATFNVGPYTTNSVNNETLSATLSASNSVTVSGLFYDCSNNLITNGYVTLTSGSETYNQTITNGAINISILYCNVPTNITVIAYDYDNIQESNTITTPVVSPITNLGNLIACNSVSEYATFSIDGGAPTTVFPPFTSNENAYLDSITNLPVTSFSSFGSGFEIICYGTALGSYPWGFNQGEMYFYSNGVNIGQGQVVNINFQLVAYGAVGTYVDISFSGTYVDYVSLNTRTISGTIHVLRDI